MPLDVQALNADMARIVERVRASLVRINNGRRGIGAGTIWHGDGLILTNAHVADHSTLTVTLPDGRMVAARLLGRDADLDLAALAVSVKGLPAMELGEPTRLRPGEWVVAVGHPWGVEGAATLGVVIGTGRDWPEVPSGRHDWLMANIRLQPGYSGGAMVDARGRLVGINTMMIGPDVGAAVPVHVATAFLRQVLAKAA